MSFKSRIDGVLSVSFCILFHFIKSLPINLIKVAIWSWNKGFYFLFHRKAHYHPCLHRIVIHPWTDRGQYIYLYDLISHTSHTEPTSSLFPILIMSNAWLGSDKYLWFDLIRVRKKHSSGSLISQIRRRTLYSYVIRPSHPVWLHQGQRSATLWTKEGSSVNTDKRHLSGNETIKLWILLCICVTYALQ